jgi:nitroimidazol reductase NimA-like FMN-containing flavoprotein (pyridoxamine 5'-phosphate oxidase superfamily)
VIDGEALERLQEASYERAAAGVRSAWPLESAMDSRRLAEFLGERRFCVFATTTAQGRPQARPVAFTVFGSSFWFATGAGGRLRNVARTPWVSLVVADGDRGTHRAVVVDGPALVLERPGEDVLAAWDERHGSRADWAAAWLEVRPSRLFSYQA